MLFMLTVEICKAQESIKILLPKYSSCWPCWIHSQVLGRPAACFLGLCSNLSTTSRTKSFCEV